MRMSYQKRKALTGYGFISIWLIGTLIWFLYPLANSLIYSFMEVKPEKGGMQGTWMGLANYRYVFTVNPDYSKYLMDVLLETLWKTPLIIIFSLFIAVILNQKFKGRTLVRAIFFLPVIIATGPVYSIINGNIFDSGMNSAGQFSTLFSEGSCSDRRGCRMGIFLEDNASVCQPGNADMSDIHDNRKLYFAG